MNLMVKYIFLVLQVYAIVSSVVLQGSSASTKFEPAPGPEGNKHLEPSLSPDTPINESPAAPVMSIPEGSPPVTQPPIPVSVPPIPQPEMGPTINSPVFPPTISVQITPPPKEVIQSPPPVAQAAPPPSMPHVPPFMPESPPPSPMPQAPPPLILPEPVASPPTELPKALPPVNLPLPAVLPPTSPPPSNLPAPITLPTNSPPSPPTLTVPPPVPVASPPTRESPPSPPTLTMPPPGPVASAPSTLPTNSPPSPPTLSVPPPSLPVPVASPPTTLPRESPPSSPTLTIPPPGPVASPQPSEINAPQPHPQLPVPVALPPPTNNSSMPPQSLPEPPISPPKQTTNNIAPTQRSPPPGKAPIVQNAPPPPTNFHPPPSLPPVYPPPPPGPKSHNHPSPPSEPKENPASPPPNQGLTFSPSISPPAKPPVPPKTTMPVISPKVSPLRSSPTIPKPLQALPPPPPNEDCSSITCMEPLTNTPPGTPCKCVLPMQVELKLGIALYTFFPLVTELAFEMASGLFMRSSQVRIMGANEDDQDPETTLVLIDFVPLGEKFDNYTAYLTAQKLWLKQVPIKSSLFGDYQVLFVKYPGLPPSPPMASSNNGQPYGGHGRDIKPLGVDVTKQRRNTKLNGGLISIISLTAVVAVVLLCVAVWALLVKRPTTQPTTLASLTKSSGVGEGSGPDSASLSFRSSIHYKGSAKTFSLNDMEKATDNFNELGVLGEGGFGRVYSGVLEDDTKVAVKVLKRDDQQGGREFLAEVEMLSRLHHRNLVRLLGICTEERTRCLVYELIPNGSVESHLHGIDKETAPLDWGARLKIALGAARGLAYLHEDSSPRVIHRDFKSSNILLEHDFTPKVSDFGLARSALDEENQHISTRVMGTFGYVAPEYAMTGHLLVKSDVYSYGVVLLELLTGRKPVDMSMPSGQENLVAWARPLLPTPEGLNLLIDPSLSPEVPFDSIAKVAAIASMCVQPEVSHRPFMGEVVQALKLVCNECEETQDLGSRTCSQEDLTSLDFDPRAGLARSPYPSYESPLDVESGFSGLADSYRLTSSSGPLRPRRPMQIWERMKRFSSGSMSDYGDFLRLLSRSR